MLLHHNIQNIYLPWNTRATYNHTHTYTWGKAEPVISPVYKHRQSHQGTCTAEAHSTFPVLKRLRPYHADETYRLMGHCPLNHLAPRTTYQCLSIICGVSDTVAVLVPMGLRCSSRHFTSNWTPSFGQHTVSGIVNHRESKPTRISRKNSGVARSHLAHAWQWNSRCFLVDSQRFLVVFQSFTI